MSPKKSKTPVERPKEEAPTDHKPNVPQEATKNEDHGEVKAIPSKRKANTTDAPAKAPRRSARGAPQSQPDAVKLVNYLLSPASLDSCRPKDEIEDVKNRSSDLRTYSASTFNPFEELMCAVILSRPISHALGLRSIRTLFNDPYNYTIPKRIRDAGFDPVRKALDEARTQHRQKTAEELIILADAVVDHLATVKKT